MKHSFFSFLIVAGFLTQCLAVEPVRLEAESKPYNGDVQVLAEEGASGGSYLSTQKPYGPLLIADVPEGILPVTVWVRARGHAVCLKALAEDKTQKELKWVFQMPPQWTWRSFGTYDRSQIGKRVLIIRSDKGTEDAGLDVLIFSEDPAYDPNQASPEVPTTPAPLPGSMP
ncbi:MAG: hypothetical protein SFU85_04995 [Candidatus Methylacidiphilales bacterium]|nr:hypothetical protein [Candidatus Methylacidiphilales bacterium]